MRREWIEKDYYAVLGVAKTASGREIKTAFRRLAQQYHPDANEGDPTAEERFKDITEAYEVLGDKEQRREYDEVRDSMARGAFVGGPGGARYTRFDLGDLLDGGLGDVFSVFGGVDRPQPGADATTQVTLSFHEALAGATRKLVLDGGVAVNVRIPAGVANGTRIRVRGKGGPGRSGGPPGDLYVLVNVGSHPLFDRQGDDLLLEVPIGYAEATLGAEIRVPTLEGAVTVKVPPGTRHGTTLRVRNKGVARAGGRRGDLLVKVSIAVPAEIDAEERTLVEGLRPFEDERRLRQRLGV